jgi:hypothetical protein
MRSSVGREIETIRPGAVWAWTNRPMVGVYVISGALLGIDMLIGLVSPRFLLLPFIIVGNGLQRKREPPRG